MAVNDITIFETGAFGTVGSRRYISNLGATGINPGEPVYIVPGQPYVGPMATSKPVLTDGAQDYIVGIACSTSTQTASKPGVVDVIPIMPGMVFEISPATAATYGLTKGSESQATYNSLVGYRVTIDLTSSTYTLNASDGASNGCVVQYRDVNTAKGKVAFSFRQGCVYLGGPKG